MSWLSPLFEADRNIKRALGMKPHSAREKETIYFKSKNLFEQWDVYV